MLAGIASRSRKATMAAREPPRTPAAHYPHVPSLDVLTQSGTNRVARSRWHRSGHRPTPRSQTFCVACTQCCPQQTLGQDSSLAALAPADGSVAYLFFTSLTDVLGGLSPVEVLLGKPLSARKLDPDTTQLLNAPKEAALRRRESRRCHGRSTLGMVSAGGAGFRGSELELQVSIKLPATSSPHRRSAFWRHPGA